MSKVMSSDTSHGKGKEETPSPASSSPKTPSKRTTKKKQSPSRVQHISLYRNHHGMIVERSEDEGVERDGQTPPPTGTRRKTPSGDSTRSKDRDSTYSSGSSAGSSRRSTPQRQLSGSPSQSPARFQSYMSLQSVQKGLKKGELIEGMLRINPKNYEDSYITAPDGEMDIYIMGVHDRNRALQGDAVVVCLNPLYKSKVLKDILLDFLIGTATIEDFFILYDDCEVAQFMFQQLKSFAGVYSATIPKVSKPTQEAGAIPKQRRSSPKRKSNSNLAVIKEASEKKRGRRRKRGGKKKGEKLNLLQTEKLEVAEEESGDADNQEVVIGEWKEGSAEDDVPLHKPQETEEELVVCKERMMDGDVYEASPCGNETTRKDNNKVVETKQNSPHEYTSVDDKRGSDECTTGIAVAVLTDSPNACKLNLKERDSEVYLSNSEVSDTLQSSKKCLKYSGDPESFSRLLNTSNGQISDTSAKDFEEDVETHSSTPVLSESYAKDALQPSEAKFKKPSGGNPTSSAIQIVPLHELLECEDYDEFWADTASDMESQTSELEVDNLLPLPDLNESRCSEDPHMITSEISREKSPQKVEKTALEICDDTLSVTEHSPNDTGGFKIICKTLDKETLDKETFDTETLLKGEDIVSRKIDVIGETGMLLRDGINFEKPEVSNSSVFTDSSDNAKNTSPEVHPSHLEPNDIPSDNHLKHEHSHKIPKATNPSCTNASVDIVNSAKEMQPVPVQTNTELHVEEKFNELNIDSSGQGQSSDAAGEEPFSKSDNSATEDQTAEVDINFSCRSELPDVAGEEPFGKNSSCDGNSTSGSKPRESVSVKNEGGSIKGPQKPKSKGNSSKSRGNHGKERLSSESDKGGSASKKGRSVLESDKTKNVPEKSKRKNSIEISKVNSGKQQNRAEKDKNCVAKLKAGTNKQRSLSESDKGAFGKDEGISGRRKQRNTFESDKGSSRRSEIHSQKSKRRNSRDTFISCSRKEGSSSEKDENGFAKEGADKNGKFKEKEIYHRKGSLEKNSGIWKDEVDVKEQSNLSKSHPESSTMNDKHDRAESRTPWKRQKPVTVEMVNDKFKKFFKSLEEREEKINDVKVIDECKVTPENQTDFSDIVSESTVQPIQGLTTVDEGTKPIAHKPLVMGFEQKREEAKDGKENCKVSECKGFDTKGSCIKGNGVDVKQEFSDISEIRTEEESENLIKDMSLEENERKEALEERQRLKSDEITEMLDSLEMSLETPSKVQDDEMQMEDVEILQQQHTAKVIGQEAGEPYQDLGAGIEEELLKDDDSDGGEEKEGVKKKKFRNRRGYASGLASYMDIPLFLTPQQIAKHPFAQRFLQRTGHVVYILERKHSRFATGRLKTFLSEDSNLALFTPTDFCVPRMKIPIDQCPDDFLNKPEAYENTLFLAQITDWEVVPFADGKLVSCLGDVKDIDTATKAILLDHNFDAKDIDTPEYVEELQQIPFIIAEEEIYSRKDFRQECVFTIDPSTARDLDDAVSCQEIGPDQYRVAIHIADVSHFLKEGTRADLTASERATSVYMVNMVLPMLPRHLCENLCSLNPGEDKLSFSVELEVNNDGVILGDPWIGRSIINSCCKLSYDHAQLMIEKQLDDLDEGMFPVISGGFKLEDLYKKVGILHKLTKNLRGKRDLAGRLRLDQPKLAFHLNESMTSAHSFYAYTIKDSNRLIEELMLLANTCVAEFLHKTYPELAVLRGHPHPRRRLLEETVDMLEKYGIFLQADSSRALNQSLQKYVGKDFYSRARYQALVNLLARPMVPARYMCAGSIQEFEGFHHYALNLDLYTHFTSPIRRYADVLVHRLLSSALQYTEEPTLSTKQIHKLAAHCNNRKMAARYAQEKSSELFLGQFIQDAPQQCWCIVVSVTSNAFDVLFWELGNVVKRVYINKIDVQSVVYHRDHGNSKLILKWECEEESRIYSQEICLLVVLRVELSFVKGSGLLATALAPHKWPPMPSTAASS